MSVPSVSLPEIASVRHTTRKCQGRPFAMTKSIIAERRGPSRYGVPCALSLAFCSIFTLAVSAHADIPSRPAERQSLHDLAGTISDADEQESRTMQQQVFDQVELPIVVVTVNRMHDYLPDASDIESFARHWFDQPKRLFWTERDLDNAHRASRQADLESTAANAERLVLDPRRLR